MDDRRRVTPVLDHTSPTSVWFRERQELSNGGLVTEREQGPQQLSTSTPSNRESWASFLVTTGVELIVADGHFETGLLSEMTDVTIRRRGELLQR